MQTGAPLYIKDKINLIAKKKKKKKKKTALPTWKNCDGWTLNNFFFLPGLILNFFMAHGMSMDGHSTKSYIRAVGF